MPASSVVQVQGLNETIRALRQVDQGLLRGLSAAGKASAILVAEEGRRLAPVRTGALRASIRPTASRGRAAVRAGNARVVYAAPIHWGWPAHGIKPNPFLVRAADARIDDVARLYERGIDELLTRAGF